MVSFRVVDLARLQGQLNIAGVRKNDEPLYAVVSQLISAVKQVQDTVNFNISTFSNGIDVSAGTSHRTVTQLIFSNQNSVSFGLSQNTITASANPGILFSAGVLSSRYTGLTFSNSNNVNFGNAAGVVTASAFINVSAAGSSNNLSNIVFSNSNGVTFGLTGSTITASVATANGSINFSAGTTSNNLASVIFSNANGFSFGLDGSTITGSYTNAAGAVQTLSYFENIPLIANTAVMAIGNNTGLLHIQQFNLQEPVSVGFVRGLWSNSWVNNAFGATSSNATWALQQHSTIAAVLYSLGTGASSQSLRSVFSTSFGITYRTDGQAAGVGSNWSISINFSYPFQNTTTTFFTSYASTSASYSIQTSAISQFVGGILTDLPVGTSLSAGQWFIGWGFSTASSTSGNPNAPANSSVATVGRSSIGMSQPTFVLPFTAQTDRIQPGVGSWSTNVALFSKDSINMSDISSRAGNNALLIQFHNRA